MSLCALSLPPLVATLLVLWHQDLATPALPAPPRTLSATPPTRAQLAPKSPRTGRSRLSTSVCVGQGLASAAHQEQSARCAPQAHTHLEAPWISAGSVRLEQSAEQEQRTAGSASCLHRPVPSGSGRLRTPSQGSSACAIQDTEVRLMLCCFQLTVDCAQRRRNRVGIECFWRHFCESRCASFALRFFLCLMFNFSIYFRQSSKKPSALHAALRLYEFSAAPKPKLATGGNGPSDPCTLCPAGSYSPGRTLDRCVPCEFGTTSPVGSTRSRDCYPTKMCPPGTRE